MLNADKTSFLCFFFINSNVSFLNVFSNLLQKKSNGAPNGFYAEIDWERYVSIRLFFNKYFSVKKSQGMLIFKIEHRNK